MKHIYFSILTVFLLLFFTGCSYRSDSGITPPSPEIYVKPAIKITTSPMEHKNCKTIDSIHAVVKKLTLGHTNPTRNQVDYILAEKGKKIGANVVRNTHYNSGIGFTTWGYIEAFGDASKCDLKNK